MVNDEKTIAEAFLEMQDNLKTVVEAATGIKAMALREGFREKDASRMGADAFNFALQASLAGIK